MASMNRKEKAYSTPSTPVTPPSSATGVIRRTTYTPPAPPVYRPPASNWNAQANQSVPAPVSNAGWQMNYAPSQPSRPAQRPTNAPKPRPRGAGAQSFPSFQGYLANAAINNIAPTSLNPYSAFQVGRPNTYPVAPNPYSAFQVGRPVPPYEAPTYTGYSDVGTSRLGIPKFDGGRISPAGYAYPVGASMLGLKPRMAIPRYSMTRGQEGGLIGKTMRDNELAEEWAVRNPEGNLIAMPAEDYGYGDEEYYDDGGGGWGGRGYGGYGGGGGGGGGGYSGGPFPPLMQWRF